MKESPIVVCFYCGRRLKETDKFCTYCGKARKEKDFDPSSNIISMLYGPPYSAKYTCARCNIEFTDRGLGGPNTRYCPNCGQECDCRYDNPKRIRIFGDEES